MTAAEIIAALSRFPSDTRVLVPGLREGFDETAGPTLRSLVAVASDVCQTSMGTWMVDPGSGDYPDHCRTQAIVLGRVPA